MVPNSVSSKICDDFEFIIEVFWLFAIGAALSGAFGYMSAVV